MSSPHAPVADPVPGRRRFAWRAGFPAQLTITYGLLVAATLLLVSGLTLRLTHVYMTRELDRDLQRTIRSFEEGPARRIRWEDQLILEARAWLAAHPSPPDETVAVRSNQGLVLTNAGGLPLREVPGARDALMADIPQWRILYSPSGPVRIVAVPLLLEGRQIGTLVVAASKSRLKGTLNALLWRIALAGALGLLAALVVGYSAVRRSVRPLMQMVRQVESIQASGDLSERVGLPDASDEVGRLAGAFDRMLVRLEEAFRAQRRFVADASHELRTPLTVVRGHLELLARNRADPQAERWLTIATAELDSMARIVQDLLLLARLDEGFPLEQHPVEVDLALRESVIRALAPPSRPVTIDSAPDLYVQADPERLLQVLTNLITNAVQHGGRDVRVSLAAYRDGPRVRITVADTGPGIPPEDLAHIFERFYRGTAARSRTGGVGLGLPIAASLARAMGGEILVRSIPGQGTVFTVLLPAASPPFDLREA